MTRGIAETRRRLVEWPLKYDAHTWPRSADRRTLRPTGRGEYGYNRVQEIVSGTDHHCIRFLASVDYIRPMITT